jgi:hypothetical protein
MKTLYTDAPAVLDALQHAAQGNPAVAVFAAVLFSLAIAALAARYL